eukprot:2609630-Rhodomonas_salina.2
MNAAFRSMLQFRSHMVSSHHLAFLTLHVESSAAFMIACESLLCVESPASGIGPAACSGTDPTVRGS